MIERKNSGRRSGNILFSTTCRVLTLSCVALLVFAVRPAFGQTVSAEKGCIVYKAKDGKTRQLTSGGKDSDPALSPDGRTVVFVRDTPERMIWVGAGDTAGTELYLLGLDDARGPQLLVRGRQSEKMENVLAGFASPQFSPDGKTLYFLSAAWATSDALHTIDPVTKKIRYICPANSLEVVPRGEYRGKLIISQHRYFLGGGSYDWHYLIEPNGKEIGEIGETTENFKELYLEDKGKEKVNR